MNFKTPFMLFLFLLTGLCAAGQKPFTEGTAIYKIKLETINQDVIEGSYSFIIKGGQIRKEIKLNNGYQDVVIFDCISNKVYSLQNRNGKKYAIELSMPDFVKKQQKFTGFILKNEACNPKNIAGFNVIKGNIKYKDGSADDIYYTSEWQPAEAITFERFPDAKFFPLFFAYKDDANLKMEFEATKITPEPIENGVFRIPADYKMISYSEYKELTR